MNINFDLNVNNYTIKELEDLLGLQKEYNEESIQAQLSKLRNNIMNDNNITISIKKNTLDFLGEVTKKLVSEYTNKQNVMIGIYKNIYNLDKNLDSTNTLEEGSTQIQEKPIRAYANSSPSEFFRGTLNPLSKRILRQNINIDTRFRDNYYTTSSTNFHLDLPIRLTQVVSLQLAAMEWPSTWYTISKIFGNNSFSIQSGTDTLLITIPDGNYNYLSLQTYLNNFVSTAAAPFNQIQFLVDLNTPMGSTPLGGSGKMIIGSTTGTLQFSLNFLTGVNGYEDKGTPLPLRFGWLMGFREGIYENNTTYVSEGLVDLVGCKYIYVVVDDFNNSVNDGFYGAFNSSILNKNILARITIQGSIYSIQSQNNLNIITTPRQYFGPVDIQKMQIQLLDEYGRVLDLNNMDYSFVLQFQTIYDL
uniref:Uncharacterized protein n=1 Tax=viral metagenome TaxID=1070528 RepID=A0A6C0IWL8_9ZZZZ